LDRQFKAVTVQKLTMTDGGGQHPHAVEDEGRRRWESTHLSARRQPPDTSLAAGGPGVIMRPGNADQEDELVEQRASVGATWREIEEVRGLVPEDEVQKDALRGNAMEKDLQEKDELRELVEGAMRERNEMREGIWTNARWQLSLPTC
jgi:hypothetical protein